MLFPQQKHAKIVKTHQREIFNGLSCTTKILLHINDAATLRKRNSINEIYYNLDFSLACLNQYQIEFRFPAISGHMYIRIPT